MGVILGFCCINKFMQSYKEWMDIREGIIGGTLGAIGGGLLGAPLGSVAAGIGGALGSWIGDNLSDYVVAKFSSANKQLATEYRDMLHSMRPVYAACKALGAFPEADDAQFTKGLHSLTAALVRAMEANVAVAKGKGESLDKRELELIANLKRKFQSSSLSRASPPSPSEPEIV